MLPSGTQGVSKSHSHGVTCSGHTSLPHDTLSYTMAIEHETLLPTHECQSPTTHSVFLTVSASLPHEDMG